MNSNTTIKRLPLSLSVVVPVYRSQGSLALLVQQLQPILDAAVASYEVILVNDGSPDESWKVINELTGKYPWVRGINLTRNYGQHNALLCGIRAAKSEVIVTMDDDLQHVPEEVPLLLEKLEQGYDVVYGTPIHQQHGWWRDIASTVTKFTLQSTMGTAIAKDVSAFRAFRSQLRDGFEFYQAPFVSIDVLLSWTTTRFGSVAVRHEPRRIGESNYTFGKLLLHAINMFTGFTVRPLKIASLVGLFFTFFGAAVLVYAVGRYLWQGTVVPGFPFLASIIAIFSGAQLFAIGIIGEYLARVHYRLMERPAYVVRSTIGKAP